MCDVRFYTWSSVYPRNPFMGPSAAAFITFLMSSYLAWRRGVYVFIIQYEGRKSKWSAIDCF